VALTGDLMNSDRRLDELLNQATNRSQATFLAVDILQQALQELNKSFNISVACVTGNEGRVNKEYGWSPVIATDNYDFTIFNILKYICKDSQIEFIEGDPTELVVNVAGQNLLLMHGNCSLRHAALDKSINQVLGRYSMKGVKLDYIIMGHVHSASVGDNYARSASVAGANDYSDKGLNLTSRASQNCYIFYENGNRDGIKIDLQNVPKKGYDIGDSLVAYNAKSVNKSRTKTRIMEIVI
jgi:predicted phosphodiesterase